MLVEEASALSQQVSIQELSNPYFKVKSPLYVLILIKLGFLVLFYSFCFFEYFDQACVVYVNVNVSCICRVGIWGY